MKIRVTKVQGRVSITVFHIEGEIGAASAEQLRQQAHNAFGDGMRDLLLDLTDVTFLSSGGLRAVHEIFTLLRTDADDDESVRQGIVAGTYRSPHLKLLKPNKNVLKSLKLTGLDMFLEIHSNLQEAIDSY